jgi:hypothetical protein
MRVEKQNWNSDDDVNKNIWIKYLFMNGLEILDRVRYHYPNVSRCNVGLGMCSKAICSFSLWVSPYKMKYSP